MQTGTKSENHNRDCQLASACLAWIFLMRAYRKTRLGKIIDFPSINTHLKGGHGAAVFKFPEALFTWRIRFYITTKGLRLL